MLPVIRKRERKEGEGEEEGGERNRRREGGEEGGRGREGQLIHSRYLASFSFSSGLTTE